MFNNPNSFYKQFEKRKYNVKSELSNDDFYNHFLNLALNEPTSNNEIDNFLTNYDTIDTDDSVSSLIDNDITEREISNAIHKLKKNKACGYDGLLNEYFINCMNVLMPCLLILFNTVFKSGHFLIAGQLDV